MKIKPGMYVKLREDNSCGCGDCERACSGFHRVEAVNEDLDCLYINGCGEFDLGFDFEVKVYNLENK